MERIHSLLTKHLTGVGFNLKKKLLGGPYYYYLVSLGTRQDSRSLKQTGLPPQGTLGRRKVGTVTSVQSARRRASSSQGQA